MTMQFKTTSPQEGVLLANCVITNGQHGSLAWARYNHRINFDDARERTNVAIDRGNYGGARISCEEMTRVYTIMQRNVDSGNYPEGVRKEVDLLGEQVKTIQDRLEVAA